MMTLFLDMNKLFYNICMLLISPQLYISVDQTMPILTLIAKESFEK